MELAKLQCPSGAPLRYAVCHTTCSSFSLRSWQLPVSFMPLRSFRPSLRFITPRSQLNNLLQGMAHLPNTQAYPKCAHSFSQALAVTLSYAEVLIGFHSAPLRPPFTSVAFRPPAAYNFACLSCLLRLRVCHGFCNLTATPDRKQKHMPNPCVLRSWHRPDGLLCHHLSRRTLVNSVRSSLHCLLCGTHQRYRVDKCATRLCFFLAAGAITFLLMLGRMKIKKRCIGIDASQ